MNKPGTELSYEQLQYKVHPDTIKIRVESPPKPPESVIGQKRAVAALRLGLGMKGAGFNIYASGQPGIGKMTAVRGRVEEVAKGRAIPPDYCYVNNFEDPYMPKALRLPAGRGRKLKQEMIRLLEHMRIEIPKAFDSEEYNHRHAEIRRTVEKERSDLTQQFNAKAVRAGFVLQITALGVAIVPVLANHVLTEEEVEAQPASWREEMEKRRDELRGELEISSKKLRQIERDAYEKIQELDRKIIHYAVHGFLEDLIERFQDLPEVIDYFKSVEKALVDDIRALKTSPPSETSHGASAFERELNFRKYQINVLVDNGDKQGAPVVIELNPSYSNLFGRIEKEHYFGTLNTDFTLIKPGSIHRANGGYVILQVEDLLRNPFSWEGLKRILKAGEIEIEDLAERLGYVTGKSLRPQAIPIDMKVILVGQPIYYHLLLAYDRDFAELFKVKAEFDTRMERNEENIDSFIGFLSTLCEREGFCRLDAAAVAGLLEHASRMAQDQKMLSTRFGIMADIVREANYWAKENQKTAITAVEIRKAIDERTYRSNLIEERVQEGISRGWILMDTTEHVVGQVNGLSVISMGDYAFGKPSRITASVGPGKDGIVDIEREVELGGPVHSKGVLILNGYLINKFAQDKPATLSCRLVFEQSYEGVEGDSASSAELYAILSALSGLPLAQGIAVTGSVNQHGEIQAIGGVNEKIEGFFDVCKQNGLTGAQGVIIPHSNVQNLMLSEEIMNAVKEGQFHIWAVKTIDEGVEILTGVPAGERFPDGKFERATVNDLVNRRLVEYLEHLKATNTPETLQAGK